jgi:membrane protein YqaA with SNARE-associated domain
VRLTVAGALPWTKAAASAALTLGRLSAPVALLLATAGSSAGALVGYFVAWFR